MRLYPRAWRERYGDEFTEVVTAAAAETRHPMVLAFDIGRGALDAHVQNRRSDMRRFLADAAVRRGIFDGLIVAALIAVVAVLTVVVFPQSPDEGDDSPEYLVQIFAAYVLIALLLMAIGARGRRRSDAPYAALKAGAVAGLVIAFMVAITYLVINNAFFSIVSQQHDKRIAFAHSGYSSMRTFINVQLLGGMLVVLPVATGIGAVLGFFGGALTGRLRPARPRSAPGQ